MQEGVQNPQIKQHELVPQEKEKVINTLVTCSLAPFRQAKNISTKDTGFGTVFRVPPTSVTFSSAVSFGHIISLVRSDLSFDGSLPLSSGTLCSDGRHTPSLTVHQPYT